nr:tyrosine-protein phosphatase [uncultured Roseococcus sp.]
MLPSSSGPAGLSRRTLGLAGLAVAAGTTQASAARAPGESLGLASVPNLREFGGYVAKDGTVFRHGLLFRANQLNPVAPADMARLTELGLRVSFDLRTAKEREAAPDMLAPGMRGEWLDVMAGADSGDSAQMEVLVANMGGGSAGMSPARIQALYVDTYRDFVRLDSARAAFRTLYTALAQAENRPAVFHCTTGKDRTGWAAAALLSLLGMPLETVYQDYLRSNDYILPFFAGRIAQFTAAGGDAALPRAMLEVRSEYLAASFAEVTQRYGSIERYFSRGLGINAAGQTALRQAFLEQSR